MRAKTGTLDAPVVLAEALVERVLGAHATVRILERFRGAAIDGVRYDPPLHYLPAATFGERGHTVLLAGFVTATEGTGLAAVAPAFGERRPAPGGPLRPGGRQPARPRRRVRRARRPLRRTLRARRRARR